MRKGLVHIYTGNGKGKTTAALGLGLRACGQGLRVGVFQFLKKTRKKSGELTAAGKLGRNFEIICFDQEYSVVRMKDSGRRALARAVARDLKRAEKAMRSKNYDVVILDEIITAVNRGLVEVNVVESVIRNKPSKVELVLTGRGAAKELFRRADYVTRMQEIRHPYRRGVTARIGVEY